MGSIPFNDFKRQWRDTRAAMLDAFEAVGASGWYILGDEVREFEAALARHWRITCACGVASGLDAIQISLRILGCRPGDRVLTTPISAFATSLAILNCGAVPVYASCDACGLVDLDACERRFRARPEVRFFVPVHLYGHSLDLEHLGRIRHDHGIRIVEDCAQSIGAQWRGERAGTVGQFATTSFYPTKNLGALGDAGAILANNSDLDAEARKYRDYGQSSKYRHEVIGYNSRLDELQAALLRRVMLPKLVSWTERRRQIAHRYLSSLENPHIRVPGGPPLSDSVWHLFPLLVNPERKRALREHLNRHGVATAEHYPYPIFDQPAMRGVEFELAGEPDPAREFCASELSLPVHPYLTDHEVERIVEACNSWQG